MIFFGSAEAQEHQERPVKRLAGKVYTLRYPTGVASVPIEMSRDIDHPQPDITRAVIVFHGKGRNVEGYFGALRDAAQEAGRDADHTLLLAPQFLREEDAGAHHLPASVLRWHLGTWSAGMPAVGPLPLSSFDIIDSLLRDLADKTRFPALSSVVLVGHSGGGQLLNRYAIVGAFPAGIHVRVIVANPSSYFYFSDDRPRRDGSFVPFDGSGCSDFNHWRYGPKHAPPYVTDQSPQAWQTRESLYASADVIYLLGTEDTDPEQRDLDTSCAGELQGPERLDRGRAYFSYLANRHPQAFKQQLFFVPGVAHVGERMIASPCAVAEIFDHGVCKSQ